MCDSVLTTIFILPLSFCLLKLIKDIYLVKNSNFIFKLCITYLLSASSYFNLYNSRDIINTKIRNFFKFNTTKKAYYLSDFTYLKNYLDNLTVYFIVLSLIVIIMIIIYKSINKSYICMAFIIISPIIFPVYIAPLSMNFISSYIHDTREIIPIALKYIYFLITVYTNYFLIGYIIVLYNQLIDWLYKPTVDESKERKLNTENLTLCWTILVFLFGLLYTKN